MGTRPAVVGPARLGRGPLASERASGLARAPAAQSDGGKSPPPPAKPALLPNRQASSRRSPLPTPHQPAGVQPPPPPLPRQSQAQPLPPQPTSQPLATSVTQPTSFVLEAETAAETSPSPAGSDGADSGEDDDDQRDQIEVGSDRDVTDVERVASIAGSELEDLARLEELRDVCRKTCVQRKVCQSNDRFAAKPAIGGGQGQWQQCDSWHSAQYHEGGDDPDGSHQMLKLLEHDPIMKRIARRSATDFGEEVWVTAKNFIKEERHKVLTARHFIAGAVAPAVGGRFQTLVNCSPDTDSDSHCTRKIDAQVFEERWEGEASLLIKRLCDKHEGEVAWVDAWSTGRWLRLSSCLTIRNEV